MNRQSEKHWMKKSLIAGFAVCPLAAAFWFISQPKTPEQILESRAESFVELATAFAWNKPDEVDMYWGSASLDLRDEGSAPSLGELLAEATALQEEISNEPLGVDPPREDQLELRLQNLLTLLEVAQQTVRPTFLEEIQRLYGITLDAIPSAELQDHVERLEELLPGRGTLAFRIAAYRNRLLVPAEKRKAVFEAALSECRERTVQVWELPLNENIELVWSRDTPAAWHSYRGNGKSVITLNDLSLAFLDSAIDVACHEAYPGHHTQYTLREFQAGTDGLNIEDSLVLLRSPESVLLEGTANLGIDLVFPAQERIQFERDVLAEIAGISHPDAEQYLAIQNTIRELEAAILPIVEEYYDGEISFNTATFRLEREAIISSPSTLLEYVDEFGTYSIGYTLAEEILRKQIESLPSKAMQWERLLEIVTNPTDNAKRLFESTN